MSIIDDINATLEGDHCLSEAMDSLIDVAAKELADREEKYQRSSARVRELLRAWKWSNDPRSPFHYVRDELAKEEREARPRHFIGNELRMTRWCGARRGGC